MNSYISQGATRGLMTDQEIMARIAELRAMLLRSSTETREVGK